VDLPRRSSSEQAKLSYDVLHPNICSPSKHLSIHHFHIYKLNKPICLVKEDLVVVVADPDHLLLLLGHPLHNKVDLPQHPHTLLQTQRLVLLQPQLKVRARAQVFSARWRVLLRKCARMRIIQEPC
jgi:hypothetical protein